MRRPLGHDRPHQLILQHRHLIHVLASGDWSGPERYAFDICRHFKNSSWNVKILTRDVRIIDRHFKQAGVEVVHAPLRDYPDYYSARVLARFFRDIPAGEGIVHVHRYNDALTGIIARKLSRRPDIRLVLTRHKADIGIDSFLRRIIYQGLDFHLFVSEYSRSRFFEGWKPGESPLDYAKTAVTFNSLLPMATTFEPENIKVPKYIVYRGGLKPGKGLETLFKAMGKIKGSRLRLKLLGKGNPDYVDSLRRLAHREGISEQIDWERRSDFPERLLRHSLFGVFPSAVPEAFGMANLELMALGKPQVTTFSGAQSEFIIPDIHALKIAPDDPEELAGAISRLADNAALRQKMGDAALDYYNKNFSWQRFLERLIPAYIPD